MVERSLHSQPYLPEGILLDILSRLPPKPLHRFKSVSTQFRQWISDPHFLSLHAARHRHRIAVLVSQKPPSSVALRPLSTDASPDPPTISLCNDFKYSYPDARIWNSCNGLVLISISQKTFFVWNPSTGEKSLVGFSPSFSSRASATGCFLIGLGCDRINDGYKVIAAHPTAATVDGCFLFSSSLRGAGVGVGVGVGSSFKCNSPRLREIGDFPYRVFQDSPGSNVDGDLYWMVVGKTRDDPVIIGFDFGAEVFVETTQPRWEPGVSKYGLGVLKGSLCVVCHGEGTVEVLGLKKGGSGESWERLFVVADNLGGMQFRTLMPLCSAVGGEVVMAIDWKRLVVYNPDVKTYRLLSDLPYDESEERWERLQPREGLRLSGSGFKVVVYVESLASPCGGSE